MSESVIQKLHNLKKFTAEEFAEIWCHYDADGNGFIEGNELDRFLKEFMEKYYNTIPENEMESIKSEFLRAIDENNDKKIDISELAKILPDEEQFLLLFRRMMAIKTSQEFLRIWKCYDKNKDGFLEAKEITEFVKNLTFQTEGNLKDIDQAKIEQFSNTIVKLYDRNGDGKLQLSELSKLLPNTESMTRLRLLKNGEKLKAEDLDRIFDHYDTNKNGTIEDEEFEGFLKDLMEMLNEPYTIEELKAFMEASLKSWDLNHDGKISKDELKMMLLQTNKF